jgi:hypothetical protein
MTAMAAGGSGAEDGQGTVGPVICAAGVSAAEMACRVDQGTSVLEGSNVEKHWAMDFGNVVGGGGSNKAQEAEEVLGSIAGDGGGRGSISRARSGWQWQSHEPLPPPSPALWASPARGAMVGMLLSSLPSLSVE